jgi:hypothetical protein
MVSADSVGGRWWTCPMRDRRAALLVAEEPPDLDLAALQLLADAEADASSEPCDARADAGLDDLSAVALLEAGVANERSLRLAEARRLCVAAAWADRHGCLAPRIGAGPGSAPGVEQLSMLGGAGTPLVAEFAPAELGAVLGVTTYAAKTLVGDALDLRHRLPRLWSLVRSGQVPVQQAREVARRTRHTSEPVADRVDAVMAGTVARANNRAGASVLGKIPWQRFVDVLDAAILRADPPTAAQVHDLEELSQGLFRTPQDRFGYASLILRGDARDLEEFTQAADEIADCLADLGMDAPRQLRRAKAIGILAHPDLARTVLDQARATPHSPEADRAERAVQTETEKARKTRTTMLYVHLTDQTLVEAAGNAGGVARIEGLGPALVERVQQWAGSSQVVVRPVIDLNEQVSVDAYEVPDRLRERVQLRTPADAFPYSPNTSRHGDLDHTNPYTFAAGQPNGTGSGRPPPGQTRDDNLARLTRLHHRLKTHGGWRMRQLHNGCFLWQSPHGYAFLVDHTGTTQLGRLALD